MTEKINGPPLNKEEPNIPEPQLPMRPLCTPVGHSPPSCRRRGVPRCTCPPGVPQASPQDTQNNCVKREKRLVHHMKERHLVASLLLRG